MRLPLLFPILFLVCQATFGQEDLGIFVSYNELYGDITDGMPDYDTIVKIERDGIIIGMGRLAKNKNGVSELKVGHWKEYHPNGNLKTEGVYHLGSYIDCCAGGACRQFYYYRSGLWKYYNENGELTYELNFKPSEFHIDTTCEGGDIILFGVVNEVPLKYGRRLTSDKIFEIQKIVTEDDYYIGIWTPLNGKIFRDVIRK